MKNIMETTMQMTLGEIVAKDYRTAKVFEAFGIDYCCKGHWTLEEVCESKKIDVVTVREGLDKVMDTQDEDITDLNFWPLNFLADYIEKKHHRFVEDRIPLLLLYLNKLCKVHGDVHRELLEITALFGQAARELTAHIKKEESILFPYIRKMLKKFRDGPHMVDARYFRSIRNPIMMMMQEHENEGNRFGKIALLTQNYTPPTDACDTYKVTYALLDEFERDLHRHIHLENNILFPKSIEFEGQAQQLLIKQ